MTRDEAAAAMNGREYRQEGTKEFFAELKAAGLVAVFGASDDLMEFRGAIDDETGAYGHDACALVDRAGLIPSDRDDGWEDAEMLAYLLRKKSATKIEAQWDNGSGYSWTYSADIPYSSFDIVETDDGGSELYCRGIVFALADLPA